MGSFCPLGAHCYVKRFRNSRSILKIVISKNIGVAVELATPNLFLSESNRMWGFTTPRSLIRFQANIATRELKLVIFVGFKHENLSMPF